RLTAPQTLYIVIHLRGMHMAEVRVRKLDQWIVDWFRGQAARHGHSLEQELRNLLTDSVVQRRQALADQLRAGLNELRDKYGTFPDRPIVIRPDRDARG